MKHGKCIKGQDPRLIQAFNLIVPMAFKILQIYSTLAFDGDESKKDQLKSKKILSEILFHILSHIK